MCYSGRKVVVYSAVNLRATLKPPKAHRSPTDLLWWSPSQQRIYISCKTQKSGISDKIAKNICTNQIKSLPSNICLPTAFPRSYFRIMQPILQFAHIISKTVNTSLLYYSTCSVVSTLPQCKWNCIADRKIYLF